MRRGLGNPRYSRLGSRRYMLTTADHSSKASWLVAQDGACGLGSEASS